MRSTCHRSSNQSGFSLIEIVLTVALLGILSIAGVNMISGSVLTNQFIGNERLILSAQRYAIERMSREIREIEFLSASESMNIATPIDHNQLSFYKSTPSGHTPVTLTYDPVAGELYLVYDTSRANEKLLLKNIVNSDPITPSNPLHVFKYFDSTGLEISVDQFSQKKVRYIQIDLSIKPDPARTQVLTLSNMIYLRNR